MINRKEDILIKLNNKTIKQVTMSQGKDNKKINIIIHNPNKEESFDKAYIDTIFEYISLLHQ